MMRLLFLDCETLGLDPVIHAVWEVAAVLAEHTDDGRLVELDSYQMIVDVTDADIAVAHPIAMEVGGFHERYRRARDCRPEYDYTQSRPPGEVAYRVDALCDDRPHLVGAVPSFDDRRVGDLMRRCGIAPRWHYHLIDVEALAVGWLGGRASLGEIPDWTPGSHWKSDDLSRALGVDPESFARHTAMGDVRWCMAQYAAIFALRQERSE